MKRAWMNIGVGVGCIGLLLSLLLPAMPTLSLSNLTNVNRSH